MSKTLLQLTQDILSAMEDDEVNSIADTVSSAQVALVVQNVFDEMVADMEIPSHNKLIELESLSDVDRPNYLKLPDNIKKVHWIKYNNDDVKYMEPEEFVTYVYNRDEGVEVIDHGGVTLKILSSKDPDYWTSFDDQYLVFDSFNIDNGSTLIANRSAAWVARIPTLEMADDAIPDLPKALEPTLLSSAKARCFVNFKQVANREEEKAARSGKVRNLNNQFRKGNRKYNSTPNYGKPRR